MAYIQFALICLIFGSNFFLMDRATRWFGAIEIGMGRLLCGGIVLALVWLLFERQRRVQLKDLRNMLIVAAIAFASPYAIQPSLIGQGYGHSFFGTTVAFTPLLTILVSIPLLGIRPTMRQLVGVLLGLVFISMLMADGSLRGIPPLFLLFAFAVPLCYAVGNTWMGRTLSHADSTPITCTMTLLAGILLSPLFASPMLQETLHVAPPEVRTDWAPAAMALVTLGAMGTGICALLFVRLVQTEGPLFAGMVTYVVPVIAMLWGLFDGEKITPLQMFAIAGIFSMVALVQAPTKKVKKALPTSDSDESETQEEAEEPSADGPQPVAVEL